MNSQRELNPFAPPFYLSRFNHYHASITNRTNKCSVHFSVATGPRNRVVPNQREILKLDPSDHVSTSVMIRNIPNNYTRKLLVTFLEDHCKTQNEMVRNDEKSAFDFVYLPIDFKNFVYVKAIMYDKAKPYWRVVEHVNHKKFSVEGVIVVEDDPDIIHFDNSSDLPLSTILNDLDNATLHIDGQSTEVDVTAASVIPISSDSSEASVGSHVPRVNLFGVILAIIPVILVVPVEVPIVPADPLDSLLLEPELPLILPFLCSDDSKADSKSELAQQRPERHESLTVLDAMVLRWRDRVASRPSSLSGSSSHDTLAPPSEFPLALVVASPRICRRLAILIRHGFTLDSSSYGSSLDFSSATSSGSPSDSLLDTSSVHSLGCDASGHWIHLHLLLDHLARCRSPTTLVPLSTPVSRSIAPTLADLLPSRKRFKDSYSLEDSKEEHMEIVTADAEAVADLGISDEVGVDTEDGIGMQVEIAASDIRKDEEKFKTA
nr:protein terminal ear1-like [Tanacetum cinerariifolium]